MYKNPHFDPDQKARQTGDLKHFLKPFFTFRLYIVFKKNRKKCHFYGNEHQCTYQQLVHGHVSQIVLSREKGYKDLVELIEKKWKGMYESASIFMREAGDDKFNTLCRRYYLGEVQEIQDPVITPQDDIRKVHYSFEGQIIQLSLAPFELPDFKAEIQNNLYQKNGATQP